MPLGAAAAEITIAQVVRYAPSAGWTRLDAPNAPLEGTLYEARPAVLRAVPIRGALIAICTLGVGCLLMRRPAQRLVIAERAVYWCRRRERTCVAAERIRTYRVKRSRLELVIGTCTLELWGAATAPSAPLLSVRGLTDVDGVRTAMEALMHCVPRRPAS